MANNRLFNFALASLALIALGSAGIANARQNIIIGTITTGYDYRDRTYDDEGAAIPTVDEFGGDKRDIFFAPEIDLQSNGIHDNLSLRYAPILRYDDLADTTDVDHYLTFLSDRFITKNWNISLDDSFVLSEDPDRFENTFDTPGLAGEAETEGIQIPDAPDQITQNLGQRRFWTNTLNLQTLYTYKEDSDIGFGYGFRVLRDDSDLEDGGQAYDEYDRHDFNGTYSYRFNSFWKTQLDLNYIIGLYDDRENPAVPENISQDLEEYRADLQLDYNQSASDTFPFIYKFRGIQYDDLRQDIWVHELTAGWNHVFDSRTQIFFGAGPSYVEAEDLDGELGYNVYLDASRAYQHGAVSTTVYRRYVPRNFTGATDTGLTYTTSARIDGSYQFTRDWSTTIFGQYSYEEIINPQGQFLVSALGGRDPSTIDSVGDVTYTRDTYSTGVSLDYAFLRWFVASLRYAYYDRNGDIPEDSYYDHRISFQIRGSKELWR